MENSTAKSNNAKKRRAMRVRKHVRGTAEKPRMCVVKTNKHIQVQIINDDEGKTIAALTTYSKGFHNTEFGKKNKLAAKALGLKIAEEAKKLGIEKVVFDRGPFNYHGILAELADAAREAGLSF